MKHLPRRLLVAVVIALVALVPIGVAWAAITETKILAGDPLPGDRFGGGWDVGLNISLDGDRMVVGAYLADVGGIVDMGAAYVFVRNAGTWSQQAKLVPSDGVAADLFGLAADIKGNTIVVGSYFSDPLGSHSGSAYVYQWNGVTWLQTQKLVASDGVEGDLFGFSLAMNGEAVGSIMAVGARDADPGGLVDAGAVYVFRWNGLLWVQEAKLVATDRAAGDRLGQSVAVDGNTIIAGAFLQDTNGVDAGAAYIFVWNGSAWSQQAKLLASDGWANDYFGFATDVQGDTAIVGAYSEGHTGSTNDRGAAYVYTRSGSTWSQQAKLLANDWVKIANFGNSVAVDAGKIALGAITDLRQGKSKGAAYRFVWSGTAWVQDTKLTASDGADGDWFGNVVAIRGSTFVVGAPKNDQAGLDAGAVYIYGIP